jgi:hypothetical protein
MNNKRDLSLRKCACADSKRAFLNNIKAIFSQKVWSFQEKTVSLQQQFPPRLLTMRTTAGLRHLYRLLSSLVSPLQIPTKVGANPIFRLSIGTA